MVTYALDSETNVHFEIEPSEEFHPVGVEQVIARVRDAVDPSILAAKAVLDRVADMKPDEVELKFGIKVNGTSNWIIAKAATEANFEVTLTWSKGATS
ncbi:CU044_2847 family protein [Streptomyces sp. GTA36]